MIENQVNARTTHIFRSAHSGDQVSRLSAQELYGGTPANLHCSQHKIKEPNIKLNQPYRVWATAKCISIKEELTGAHQKSKAEIQKITLT